MTADTNRIRRAAAEDLPTVRAITRETIEAVYPHYYPAGAVAFFLAHHNDDAIRLDIAENRVYLYISDNGQAVGTVTVTENDIGRLFVLPAHQGHGYGGALLRFAEKLIAQQYAEAVLDASFAAKAIYLRHGWQETGWHLISCENGDYLCHDTMKKCVLTQYQRVTVTTDDFTADGIQRGDSGYITELYADACEVEFSRPDGTTYAQRAIPFAALRPVSETGGEQYDT